MGQAGISVMNEIVPTFGIDEYSQRLAWVLESAPREVALVQAVTIALLGAVAVMMLGIALFRRSAIAAVSFSFLSLGALIVAMIFGQLDFISVGTQTLILCLFMCSVLLFVTATIRLARDSAIMGIVTFISILALLAAGGASMLQLVEDIPISRLVIAATTLITLVLMIVEFFRGDKGTMAVSPGLLLAIATLPAMSYVAGQGMNEEWILVVTPVLLFTAGLLMAAFAAQLTAQAPAIRQAKPRKSKPVRKQRFSRPTAVAASGAGVLQEFEDDDHHAPQQSRRQAPSFDAPAADLPREPYPATNEDLSAGAPQEEETEREYTPPPAADRPRFTAHSEPVSSQWGSGQGRSYASPTIPIADDEYVWDMMSDLEVRMGDAFASYLDLPAGQLATPDVLRELIDERSLPEFDDIILGGHDPRTGRFDVDFLTFDGATIRLQGRRQVDEDGILSRLQMQLEEIAPPRQQAPSHEEVSTPQRSGLAAVAAPIAEKPRRHNDEPTMSRGPAEALARGEIAPWFQPIVRLSDRKTVGFEALARWQRPDGNVAEAHEFVDELINAGKGVDLARIVIDQAAAELAEWVRVEPGLGQFVSVNIAAADLPKDEVASIVANAVGRHQLPAGALVVELTEGRIQASHNEALASAKAIRKSGASLAVDDFGVGYSNLNRLSKFKFDIVKLDKSLISDLTSRKKQRSVVRAMLTAAEKSGVPVVAEGIENEDTAAMLNELGCDFGQGYLFGEARQLGAPATKEDPAKDLAAQRRRPSTAELR